MRSASEASPFPAFGSAARAVCTAALGIFAVAWGVSFAVLVVPSLFRDTGFVERPAIVHVLGPLAMACIPVAFLSGIVWAWAVWRSRQS